MKYLVTYTVEVQAADAHRAREKARYLINDKPSDCSVDVQLMETAKPCGCPGNLAPGVHKIDTCTTNFAPYKYED